MTGNRDAAHVMTRGALNSNHVVEAVNNDLIFIKEMFGVNSPFNYVILCE